MSATLYEIRVRGLLEPSLPSAIDGFDVVSADEDETRLRGWVIDRADLHRVLDTMTSLGLELTAVFRLRAARPTGGTRSAPSGR